MLPATLKPMLFGQDSWMGWNKLNHDAIIIMMRTTLNLPDDVYEIAKVRAEAKRISLGDAVAEMVRKAFEPQVVIQDGDAFPTFKLPENAPVITLKQTIEAEDEL